MFTRNDRISQLTDELHYQYGDNLVTINGIGSFFHGNLNEKFNVEDRTADLHIIVKDIDKFYDKFIIPDYELLLRGINRTNSSQLEKVINQFRNINLEIPLYHKDEKKV